MEALKSALKLEMTHIPYRGTGSRFRRCWAGTCSVLFSAYPSLVGADQRRIGREQHLHVPAEQRRHRLAGAAIGNVRHLQSFSAAFIASIER